MKKGTLVYELFGKHDGGTTFDVISRKIPKNDNLCIRRIAVTNETSSTDVVTVGAMLGNKPYWLETLALSTAGYYYAMTAEVFIPGADFIVVRSLSGSSNDLYRAFVYGYYIYS